MGGARTDEVRSCVVPHWMRDKDKLTKNFNALFIYEIEGTEAPGERIE